MFETCRRAHAQHRLRVQRVDWQAPYLPDYKLQEDHTSVSDGPQAWFKVRSSFGYQHPSVVLVEGGRKTATADLDNMDFVMRRLEMNTVSFLELLFSDQWPDGGLLRVLQGKLLDNLLHALTVLENYHDIISYSTMAFINGQNSRKPCLKTDHGDERLPSDDSDEVKVMKIMVEFEVFCPQLRPLTGLESQILGAYPAGDHFIRSGQPGHDHLADKDAVPATGASERERSGHSSVEALVDPTAPALVTDELSFLPKSPGTAEAELNGTTPADLSTELHPKVSTNTVADQRESRDKLVDSLDLTISQSLYESQVSAGEVSDAEQADVADRAGSATAVKPALPATRKTRSSSFGIQMHLEDRQPSKGTWPTESASLKDLPVDEDKVEGSQSAEGDLRRSNQDVEDSGVEPFQAAPDQASESRAGLPKLHCNIRGFNQPPPHDCCLSPYHMLHQLLQQRRRRCQPPFDPKVFKQRSATESSKKLDEDEKLHRPNLVAFDIFLGRISEHQVLQARDSPLSHLLDKPMSKKRRTVKLHPKTKYWKQKTVKKIHFRLRENAKISVDPAREDRLQTDLCLMDSELLVERDEDEQGILQQLLAPTGGQKPKRSLGALSAHRDSSLRTDSSKRKSGGPSDSDKHRVRSKKVNAFFRSVDTPLNALRTWRKCPAFDEFYYYLKGLSADEIESALAKQRMEHEIAQSPEWSRSASPSTSGSSLDARLQTLAKKKKVSLYGAKELTDGKSKRVSNVGGKTFAEVCMPAFRLYQSSEKGTQSAVQPGEAEATPSRSKQRGKQKSTVIPPSKAELLPVQVQEAVLSDSGMVLSNVDPWHISVRFARLIGGLTDSTGMKSDLLKRGEKIRELVDSGKFVLKLNKKSMWSLVRQMAKQERSELAASSRKEEGSALLIRPTSSQNQAERSHLEKGQTTGVSSEFPQSREGLDAVDHKEQHLGKLQHESTDRIPLNRTVPFLDDSKIPDNISERDLFDMMEVGKEFDINKLRSTYSFDNFVGPRSRRMCYPLYMHRRKRYTNPLTKKTLLSKEGRRKLIRSKDDKERPSVFLADEDETLSTPSPSSSPQPAVVRVLGKLRPFKFLQHKDYKPETLHIEQPLRSDDITADELCSYLLQAMQMFVVRKERATTPFQSKVSITFSKYCPQDVASVPASRQLVTALCNTLLVN